ncbi:MAG TPA: hypothetical protein VLL27_10570 [Solirubrobacterales bacterium]|nr:hypothetical protein [Solirubrobacterales bacterium]
MGLSDDQRAMLRLVAQRGEQGYEDIAALKGLSVEDVRAQVAAALGQLDDEGALAGSAAAEKPPAAKPEKPASAAPEAKEPPKPAPAPAAPAPAAAPKSPRKKPSMPSRSGLRAAIAAGVIVIALIVIIGIVSSSGGGDDSTTGASSGDQTTAASNKPTTDSKQVTKAILNEVGGSGAKGVAIFGRFKNKLALELAAEGLEATPKGTSYTVWLAASPQKMLPLASTAVPSSGKIGAQFEVPVEVLAYLASETFSDIVVTRTDDATLETALAAATKAKEAPEYTGESVLSGTVTGPVVGAQVRQEEKKEEG